MNLFSKLILNNEFLKSLLGLCLLLVLYAHSDIYHDLNWILNIYSLHGYSFLKIIQIYLKTTKQITYSRPFIKYLSAIEETILSQMAFSINSALWNEIQIKGIVHYQHLHSPKTPTTTSMYIQSPNQNHVARKLFQNTTDSSTNVRIDLENIILSMNNSIFTKIIDQERDQLSAPIDEILQINIHSLQIRDRRVQHFSRWTRIFTQVKRYGPYPDHIRLILRIVRSACLSPVYGSYRLTWVVPFLIVPTNLFYI
jgi:hypothetical protein